MNLKGEPFHATAAIISSPGHDRVHCDHQHQHHKERQKPLYAPAATASPPLLSLVLGLIILS